MEPVSSSSLPPSNIQPQAGPSNSFPTIFPPPQPFPRQKQYLRSTLDLLDVFNLHPAYNKYVKEPLDTSATGKGKEKEKEVPPGVSASATPGAQQPGEEGEDGGDKKKKKDTYRHLIKGTPVVIGRHAVKKDNYFQTLLGAPEKQRIQVHPLDPKTLRDGFYVTPTGLPMYNKSLLVGTDPKEKEARRLKKEQRRAEKEKARLLQQQQQQLVNSVASTPAARPAPTPHPSTTIGTPTPRTGGTPVPGIPSKLKARASPHPGTPRILASGSFEPPKPVGQNVGTPATVAGKPKVVANGVVLPVVNTNVGEKRGIKREATPVTPTEVPGGGGLPSQRPQKKRRLGSGTPQPSPIQQPTPHGS